MSEIYFRDVVRVFGKSKSHQVKLTGSKDEVNYLRNFTHNKVTESY